MKKVLITVILSLSFLGASAQMGSGFTVNTFASLQGGITSYYNHANDPGIMDGKIGFTGGLAVGKWICSPLALRLGFDFMSVSKIKDVGNANGNYFLASAEFMWDIANSIISHHREIPLFGDKVHFSIYPMLGLGYVYKTSQADDIVDHDFHAMLGIQVPFHFKKSPWDFFIEYKHFAFPENFDFAHGHVSHNTFTLGATRNFSETPYHRHTENESRNVAEDWFAGLGLGINVTSYTFTNLDKWEMYGFPIEVMFGKNLSNFWTIRIQAAGGPKGTIHSPYDTISHTAAGHSLFHLHADVMVNLTHALKFTRGVKLNVMPYVGSGLVSNEMDPNYDLAADFGVFFRYYISRHSDLYLDIRNAIIKPRIVNGVGPDIGSGNTILTSGVVYVWVPSVTVGYIYNFGRSTSRYRLPITWTH